MRKLLEKKKLCSSNLTKEIDFEKYSRSFLKWTNEEFRPTDTEDKKFNDDTFGHISERQTRQTI